MHATVDDRDSDSLPVQSEVPRVVRQHGCRSVVECGLNWAIRRDVVHFGILRKIVELGCGNLRVQGLDEGKLFGHASATIKDLLPMPVLNRRHELDHYVDCGIIPATGESSRHLRSLPKAGSCN